MTTPPQIRAPKPTPLSGEEVVAGTDAKVVDFWRFALSNLRMNNARGYLAEFLVAKAVGSTGLRIEWDPYDVMAPDGTTIEVKTSAYLQAWDQYKLSTIQFTGLRSRIWTTEGGLTPTPTYNADVYVFAIQTARTRDRKSCDDAERDNGEYDSDKQPRGQRDHASSSPSSPRPRIRSRARRVPDSAGLPMSIASL